ncbi:ATP-binding protein [Hoeflea olei]|uniref:YhaN AAA domain-containing protein n=1 Tax=Hoeflea olei TaxID=1480615 RepID=A0A1C1YWD6_9HYPH|nr:AAA family ATPase [Hoeflea olei]OCW57811.1 hypothetical protein AWJ14_03170 [Hoeflea olei]
MRLDRLDLTRYGKFTDHAVDFGTPVAGGSDLHIVYGPNEAGKSTLFNAWLDLLFGIGAQSSYNFLHPYPTMRIGARISIDGEARDFVRIKRQQNSLLDGHDQPVADGALQAGLTGLDRDSYKTMFSLDDETLEQGGESILASRGDLGELLFSASAGLGELSQRLVGIRSETEDFYKYRARSGRLADLKGDLANLKAERDRLDTQASEHGRLTKALEEASRLHAETSAERKTTAARLAEIDRLLQALPRLGERAALRQTLEPLADLPEVAPEWREDIRGLRDGEAALEAEGAALAAEIERLEVERETMTIDPATGALAGRMADLDRQRTRHNAAEEDLPERRAALARLDGRIEQLLIRLGRPDEADARHLLLDAATTAALGELIEARTRLDVRLAAAKAEAAAAKTARDEALARLRDAGGDPDETDSEARQAHSTALATLVAGLSAQDHGLRLKAAERALPDLQQKAEAGFRVLSPWRGDPAALAAMIPPPADTLRAWTMQAEELGRKRATARDECARLTHALARHEAEAAAIAETGSLPTAETLAALRAARDTAWRRHEAAMDAPSAKDFAEAMQAHDAAVDRRASHQAEVARLNEASLQIALHRADLAAAERTQSRLDAEQQALGETIAAAAAALSPDLAIDMDAATLADWLARRERALEAGRELDAQLRERDLARADREDAAARLAGALTALGVAAAPEDGYEPLLAQARTLLARETALQTQRTQALEQERALARRLTDLQSAEEELDAWLLAWKQASAKSWLGEAGRAPTVAEVREMLPLLAELAAALHDRDSLAERIGKMEGDRQRYAETLRATAREAGIEPGDMAVNALARALASRVAEAEQAAARHADLTTRLEDALARSRAHAEKADAHALLKTRMLDALGADTLTDAALRLDRALERKSLTARIGEVERQISESLGSPSFDAARALLEAADGAALGAERQDLEAVLETLDAEVQERYAARRSAEAALAAVGGDDAVARIEQRRRTVLLAIAEGAEHYLRLSAGILAMEQALTLYRERHRSSMMARASEAISTISRGRYTGLAAQPDKGRELLIALQNDGASKQAADMSKGARFQLYLALRVAGYHEFAETRRPVPFIADDIMETFDDFRAEEAFRLFAGMAKVGQVIYLTHHRHLCDIAQSVCPDVTIHELSA